MVIPVAPLSAVKLLIPSVIEVTAFGLFGLVISIICTALSLKAATKA